MYGLLNLDKPSGMTSRDAVNHVQRLTRRVKIGHAGTLDPLAQGVLVLCLGPATRLISHVQRMPKSYRGRFQLGLRSDTEDIQGNVEPLDERAVTERAEVAAALPAFVGAIEQVPPAYSALKVAGRRAYALAREGRQVDLAPRTVHVHHLELLEFAYPYFSLEIVCGSGTYVRSLGRDIARAVGSEAVMTHLERTAIGPFLRSDAHRLRDLHAENLAACLLPAGWAVADLPRVELAEPEVAELRQGRTIANRWECGGTEIAGFDAQGELVALLAPAARAGQLRPTRNFGPA